MEQLEAVSDYLNAWGVADTARQGILAARKPPGYNQGLWGCTAEVASLMRMAHIGLSACTAVCTAVSMWPCRSHSPVPHYLQAATRNASAYACQSTSPAASGSERQYAKQARAALSNRQGPDSCAQPLHGRGRGAQRYRRGREGRQPSVAPHVAAPGHCEWLRRAGAGWCQYCHEGTGSRWCRRPYRGGRGRGVSCVRPRWTPAEKPQSLSLYTCLQRASWRPFRGLRRQAVAALCRCAVVGVTREVPGSCAGPSLRERIMCVCTSRLCRIGAVWRVLRVERSVKSPARPTSRGRRDKWQCAAVRTVDMVRELLCCKRERRPSPGWVTVQHGTPSPPCIRQHAEPFFHHRTWARCVRSRQRAPPP
jgi:hypothetical protein